MRRLGARIVAACIVFVWAWIGTAQDQPRRDEILPDVKTIARRHAESGSGKDRKYVLDLDELNSAGVSRQELLKVAGVQDTATVDAYSGLSKNPRLVIRALPVRENPSYCATLR